MSEPVESAFKELPPLPDVAMRLIDAVNDERSGTSLIVGILRSDAALTAEVLRRANSPLFGLSAQVASAAQAVMLLGTDQIRHLAMTISLADHFGSGQRSIRRLWRHAFARALVAERIARVCDLPPEMAYTAALLADIGVHGLLVSFPQAEQRILETAGGAGEMLAGERCEFGVDHCQAGEWLAQRWHLPGPIVAAVRGHHEGTGSGPTLASVAGWADEAATFLAFGFLGPAMNGAQLDRYEDLRVRVPAAAEGLPADAEELFDWLVSQVPA